MMRVTVTNKGESKDYLIHKNLLCQRSPYFAALKNFREGETNHIVLDDMNHNAFRKIITYVYKRDLRYKPSDDTYTLIKTWAAAHRLLMNACNNVMMDLIRRFLKQSGTGANISGVHFIYDLGYSTDSILIQYFMDQVAVHCITNYGSRLDVFAADGLDIGGGELLCAFVKRLVATSQKWCRSMRMGLSETHSPSAFSGCKYHDHTEGKWCYSDEGCLGWLFKTAT